VFWRKGTAARRPCLDLGPSAIAGLLTAALVVIGGALAVAAAQSWRAASVDPADVLRDE
jgi:hypothetical protein